MYPSKIRRKISLQAFPKLENPMFTILFEKFIISEFYRQFLIHFNTVMDYTIMIFVVIYIHPGSLFEAMHPRIMYCNLLYLATREKRFLV